jgi:hypothetical protein
MDATRPYESAEAPGLKACRLQLAGPLISIELPPPGSGGSLYVGFPRRPPFCRQFSEVFCSRSCGSSRRVSAAPTQESPIIRRVLLQLGSCLALGRPPFFTKMGLVLGRRAHFQQGCLSSFWDRLRNTSGVQHDLFGGLREPPKGAREPPRDKPEDQTWASRLVGTPILQKRPDMMENNLAENVHISCAPSPCWPKVDADPALSTTRAGANRLRIGDFNVGGAMDGTTPYKFIWFGAMDAIKPYEFICWGHGCPPTAQIKMVRGR